MSTEADVLRWLAQEYDLSFATLERLSLTVNCSPVSRTHSVEGGIATFAAVEWGG
jgi:hypothetical protein